MSIKIHVNGIEQHIDAAPDTPLLWVLRDSLGLTGTKYGCGKSLCGACTVHLDGQPIRSCTTLINQVVGKQITTIEALQTPEGKLVQQVWQEQAVAQCGYCQSGQLMAASALLSQNPQPSDQEIDAAMSGNICRCATYHRVRAAIKQASKQLA